MKRIFINDNYLRKDDIDFDLDEFWSQIKNTSEFKNYEYQSEYDTKWMGSYFARHIFERRKKRLYRNENLRKEKSLLREVGYMGYDDYSF